MLIIKIGNKALWFVMALLVLLALCGGYYFKQGIQRKPLVCRSEVKVRDGYGGSVITKVYDINFYLSEKRRALIFINGLYIGEDNVPRILRRTFSFDAFWSANRLIVHNIALEKNNRDNAPDDAFLMLGENGVMEFEMLTRDTYLISTARAKLACNIH